ncbi:hypothetical protein MNBD_ACTINO02-1542 [hydrothermal vent metagenome]|uniref:Uncharacterized protein n=1 Tax=hydrothermal vent metagenome TaxID=652676 RepID=A0A3B0RP17_9ZZZZ
MLRRLRLLGIALIAVGLGFIVASGVAYTRIQAGYDTLQAFSQAQNVTLSYNEDGQLIDRGTTEGADAIMALLTDDWAYPVKMADLDPNDPLVNTASEYMFQMATIGYHVLNGTQTVTLPEAVEYKGETYPAGTYDFEVDGRYWTDFDRMNPIEGPARSQAWSGTVHGLFGELGVGVVTHSVLQMGLGLAGILAGLGLIFGLTGGGLVWVAKSDSFDSLAQRLVENDPAQPKATV